MFKAVQPTRARSASPWTVSLNDSGGYVINVISGETSWISAKIGVKGTGHWMRQGPQLALESLVNGNV